VILGFTGALLTSFKPTCVISIFAKHACSLPPPLAYGLYACKKAENTTLSKLIAEFIARNMWPISSVGSSGFCNSTWSQGTSSVPIYHLPQVVFVVKIGIQGNTLQEHSALLQKNGR